MGDVVLCLSIKIIQILPLSSLTMKVMHEGVIYYNSVFEVMTQVRSVYLSGHGAGCVFQVRWARAAAESRHNFMDFP